MLVSVLVSLNLKMLQRTTFPTKSGPIIGAIIKNSKRNKMSAAVHQCHSWIQKARRIGSPWQRVKPLFTMPTMQQPQYAVKSRVLEMLEQPEHYSSPEHPLLIWGKQKNHYKFICQMEAKFSPHTRAIWIYHGCQRKQQEHILPLD